MATQVYFNNKKIKLPGAYSRVIGGQRNLPRQLDYGKVLIIDNGNLGATWCGGSGIDGTLSSGKDAVYKFDNLSDCQYFLKGGLLYKVAEGLFLPDKSNPSATGVSEVYVVKAATTTPSLLTFTTTTGGSFKFNTRDEGVGSNGVLTGTNPNAHLDKGFAYTLETGVIDTAKWIMKVWVGTWVGNHTDGVSYNEIDKAASSPILVTQSPEFSNVQTLIDWANTNAGFNNHFKLDSTSAVAGTGVVVSGDITGKSGYNLASGGTETYNTTNLGLVFEAIAEMDFSFILADDYGTSDFDSTENEAIFAFMNGADNKFERFLFIGGGQDKDEFTDSLTMPANYNSSYVHIVHGQGGESSDKVGEGYRFYPSIYTAAKVLGRCAGKSPQIPITNKSIGFDKLKHVLNKLEKERSLDAGLLSVTLNENINRFVVLQGINTLQDNQILFNMQGKSHQISFMRILAQINKELVVNAEIDLLSDENGVNSNTLSSGAIKNWTEIYLRSRLAIPTQDNLLLDARNVTVTKVDDYYQVNYEVVVNNEITKLFFTGFVFKS